MATVIAIIFFRIPGGDGFDQRVEVQVREGNAQGRLEAVVVWDALRRAGMHMVTDRP